jgi:hypothetical protein
MAVLAGTIFFAPMATFLAGGRGRPIENRSSVRFTGLSSGFRSFTNFGAYVADRIPDRAQAVRADAWIDEHVFAEDPAFGGSSSPRVIRGKQGFLFLADAIDNACAPNAPAYDTVANLKALASVVKASGREVLTMVAPDKSSVHPELLPAGLPKADCFNAYSDDLWNSLAGADIPGYVDLRSALREAVTKSHEPLYLRKDSHWDSAGSAVAVKLAIDQFAPGLWRSDEITYKGLGDYTGDLTGMQGKPEVDQAPIYAVNRPDVKSVSVDVIDAVEGGPNRRFVNSAPSGRLVAGRTLLFLDSFGLVALPQIVPFFEDLTVVRFVDYSPDKFEPLLASADRVWFLSVERGVAYRLTYEVGSAEFLDRLASTLPRRPSG